MQFNDCNKDGRYCFLQSILNSVARHTGVSWVAVGLCFFSRLCFALLCFTDFFYYYKLQLRGSSALSKSICAISLHHLEMNQGGQEANTL